MGLDTEERRREVWEKIWGDDQEEAKEMEGLAEDDLRMVEGKVQ